MSRSFQDSRCPWSGLVNKLRIVMSIRSNSKHAWFKLHKLGLTGALLVVLFFSMSSAWALGARSYYPYALQPTMPNAAEAERLVAEFPWILKPFRKAHQQSLNQGWISIAPPLSMVEDRAKAAAPIANH